MWPLFLAVASAGPAELTLSGLPVGSAAAVWLKGEEDEQFAGCNDAGTAPDATADGVYTCAPLAGLAPPTELFLLHESGVAAAGDALDGGAARLHLTLDGTTLRVESSRPAAPGTAAGGAGRLLLIHLVGAPSGPLPMLTLSSPTGSTQLRCRDDGGFPDLVRNDNQPGCSGRVLTPTASLSMNSSAGPRSLGAIPAVGEVLWVRVDATAGTILPETEAIPLPGRDLPPSTPPPPPGEPSPPPPGEPSPPPPQGEPTPPPGTPTPPPGEVSPPPGAASEPPPAPVASGLAWLGAAVLAIGAAFVWRRRASRSPLPSCLEPVAPPTGGAALPTLEGKGLIVEAASALAAGELLLARAAATRRVILVADGAVAPPTDTAGVWRSTCVDSLKIARAAGQLASTPGAPVAVVVVGADVVRDPGALDPHPLANLLGALAPGIWLGVAVVPGEATDCDLPRESATS